MNSSWLESFNSLDPSIENGLKFLLKSKNHNGWWRDYSTYAGESDEWITAYVGVVLALSDKPDHRSEALNAWKRLCHRHWWFPAWGYNRLVPPDADSTLWAVRLAECLNRKDSYRVRRAIRFLLKHIGDNGGMSTYNKSKAIGAFTVLSNLQFRGWCSPHVCVSAAAVHLDSLTNKQPLIDYLGREQNGDGSWTGYWWCDDEFTTSQATEGLAKNHANTKNTVLNKAVDWAMNRLKYYSVNSCTPFVLASLLKTITFSQHPQAEAAIKIWLPKLLTDQKQDGSWMPSAWLRIPHPDVTVPARHTSWKVNGKGANNMIVDIRSIFTTATVVYCLYKVRAYLKHRSLSKA